MSRVYPDPKTLAQMDEFGRILKAIKNNRPEVLIEMWPSRRHLRKAKSAPWAERHVALGEPPPVLSFGGPLVGQSLRAFARKLFCALHYKEFSQIIPRQGHIGWRWVSNVQALEGKLPDELTSLMQMAPKAKRASRDLSDQFSYSFVRADEGDLTAYYAAFRFSFAMLGVVSISGAPLEFVKEGELLKPLAPAR